MTKLIRTFPPIYLILWLIKSIKGRREYRELRESIRSITRNQVELDPEIRTLINKNFHELLDNKPDTITLPDPIKPFPAKPLKRKSKPKSKPPKSKRVKQTLVRYSIGEPAYDSNGKRIWKEAVHNTPLEDSGYIEVPKKNYEVNGDVNAPR